MVGLGLRSLRRVVDADRGHVDDARVRRCVYIPSSVANWEWATISAD